MVFRVWKSCGEHYPACNIGHHEQSGGKSLMACEGLTMHGHRDLHRLGNGTLAAIRYQYEILGLIVGPRSGTIVQFN